MESSAETRYREGLGRLRALDFEGALEKLVGALREDPSVADGGARKCCIALFQLLGTGDPLVRRFRGEVASALYR